MEDDIRKYVSAFYTMIGSTPKPSVLHQSTAFERISHNFYMKVDSDPEVVCRDNLGNFDPCEPVDLWTRTQKLWHTTNCID